MTFNTCFFATCLVASFTLSAQPSTDETLRSAPTVTQTVEESDLVSAWLPSVASTDPVWVLPPSGSKVKTSVGAVLSLIGNNGQIGIFSLYFPTIGLRMDLIVE